MIATSVMPSLSDQSIIERAKELVIDHILGTRMNKSRLASEHSITVGDTLQRFGYSEDAIVAGYLHDVLEDSPLTAAKLHALRFSDRVVFMVETCSRQKGFQNSDAAWTLKVARIIIAGDPEIWAVAIADVIDNSQDIEYLEPDRARFMIQVKCQVILSASRDMMTETPIWKELEKLYLKQDLALQKTTRED